MSTTEINWTNRSSNVIPPPDKNVVERVEQGQFDDAADPGNTVVVAEGGGGDLSPLIATGAYTDDTMESGRNYSYRVVAQRGDERRPSQQTDYIHTYHPGSELSYPGSELTSSEYTTSVAPHVHIDTSRLSGVSTAYDDDIYNFTGATRHGPVSLDTNARDNNDKYYLRQVTNNTKTTRHIETVNYTNNTSGPGYVQTVLTTTEQLESRDEFTLFVVVRDHLSRGFNMSGITGSNASRLGDYGDNGAGFRGAVININGAASGGTSVSVNGTNAGSLSRPHASSGCIIMCVRLNMQLATSPTTGDSRIQTWADGVYMGASQDFTDQTAHGFRAGVHSNDDVNHSYGGYVLPMGTSGRPLLTYYYKYQAAPPSEYILYPHALDLEDMNHVHAYLANKYDTPVDTVSPSILIG